MSPEPATDAYGQFLALNAALATAGHYEAAYHALMAALHCAEDAEHAARLAEVAALARSQQAGVDALSPPHRLSAHRAHGTRGVFEVAAVTSEAVAKRLENKRRIDELRRGA